MAKKDQPCLCYVLNDGRSIPEQIYSRMEWNERRRIHYNRKEYSLYEILDGKKIDDTIKALRDIRKQYGPTVEFDVKVEDDISRVTVNIMRPMTADEHEQYAELDKKQKSAQEDVQRKQYEALRAKFQGK